MLELLVGLMIGGMIFAGLMQQYKTSVGLSHDNAVRIAAILQAQATLQTIGSEIRMLGNGVPFDQANFQIGEDTLSDPSVTEPIVVTTATAGNLAFRLNESGDSFLLTQDFNPAAGLTVHLTDTASLEVNDPIYISNSVVSGDDGLYGVIAAVSHGAKTITLESGPVYSPEAVFPMGSVLEEVPIVTYNSPVNGSGITRDSGFGAVLMAPNSTFELTYLSAGGNPVALPLDNTKVIYNLRAIRVTVRQTSTSKLSSGDLFTAESQQTFGIRNLNYAF